jgi:hypothetical protein
MDPTAGDRGDGKVLLYKGKHTHIQYIYIHTSLPFNRGAYQSDSKMNVMMILGLLKYNPLDVQVFNPTCLFKRVEIGNHDRPWDMGLGTLFSDKLMS